MPATAYGRMAGGAAVEAWRLGGGIEATVITYGARLASLTVPGPRGRVQVVLGCACNADADSVLFLANSAVSSIPRDL